jgi:hypothetical protein
MTTQTRPFTAATSKLAYAQAFTKPALRSTGRDRHTNHLLSSLLRRTHR